MNENYHLIPNLIDLIETLPTDSIVSRTFHKDGRLNAILFGFDQGQALSEHTSSQAVVIQIIQGEASITIGDDRHEVGAGAWLYLSPHQKHSVFAKTPLHLLLLMLGKA